jgi:hypothetical protein
MRLWTRIALCFGVSAGGLCASAGALAFSSGAGTCSYPSAGWSQMGSGQAGTGGFAISVTDDQGPVTHYTPGATYNVTISNSVPYPGFLLQCVKGMPGSPNVQGVGRFSWTDSLFYQEGPCFESGPNVTHTVDRVRARLSADTFAWTAPDSGTGSVTFHLVGVINSRTWYGLETKLIATLLEGAKTAVSSPTWGSVKALYALDPDTRALRRQAPNWRR